MVCYLNIIISFRTREQFLITRLIILSHYSKVRVIKNICPTLSILVLNNSLVKTFLRLYLASKAWCCFVCKKLSPKFLMHVFYTKKLVTGSVVRIFSLVVLKTHLVSDAGGFLVWGAFLFTCFLVFFLLTSSTSSSQGTTPTSISWYSASKFSNNQRQS